MHLARYYRVVYSVVYIILYLRDGHQAFDLSRLVSPSGYRKAWAGVLWKYWYDIMVVSVTCRLIKDLSSITLKCRGRGLDGNLSCWLEMSMYSNLHLPKQAVV